MEVILSLNNAIKCKIIRRISRFVVEGLVEGSRVLIYNNNTGRLAILRENSEAIIIPRKTKGRTSFELIGVSVDGYYALINTKYQMKSFEKLIEQNSLPYFKNCRIVKKEVKFQGSRIDYLIRCVSREILVEAKSVTHVENGWAMYPDAPTIRGKKHIKTLINAIKQGYEATIVFIVGNPLGNKFRPFREVDNVFARLLKDAVTNYGLKAYSFKIALENSKIILLKRKLPIFLL